MGNSSRIANRGRLALALVAFTLGALLALSSSAFAGPAVFSAVTPSPGATVGTLFPTMQLTADDATTIISATATVNGETAWPVSVDYPIGHWVTDDYDWWFVVDDYSFAVLTLGNPHALPVSPTTVQVSVTNANSQVSTYTWSFTADQTPYITAKTPANGLVVRSLSPTISVTLSDDDSLFVPVMTVDSVPVTPSFDAATKTFSYTPLVPFEDFTAHVVTFSATDPQGFAVSDTWSFTTVSAEAAAPVGIVSRSPGSGAVVTTSTVPIVARFDDAAYVFDYGDTQNRLYLDGSPLTTSVSWPIGYIQDPDWDPYWVVTDQSVIDLGAQVNGLADGVHQVRAHLRDSFGLVADPTWQFTVAAPPAATQLTPAGGVPTTRPTISARVTDNSPGALTVSMRVDAIPVAASFDASSGVISYTPTIPLSDATTHTATVTMTDAAGNTGSQSWSFLVQSAAAATFSSYVPTQGSTLNVGSTSVSVVASSAYQLTASASEIFLDGIARTRSAWQLTPNRVQVYFAPITMIDGLHTAKVRIRDVIGVSSETTWTFTIAAPPTISGYAPAPVSTVTIPRPQIAFTMSDNTPGSLGASLSVDGVSVLSTVAAQGVVTWTPATGFANNSSHTVAVRVTDAAGLFRTASWTFTVVAAPPMSDDQNCTACHATYPGAHPMNNCTRCHGYGEYHGIGEAPTPAGACLGCHEWNHGPVYLSGRPCTDCHTPAWPTVPRHRDTSVTADHVTTTTGCQSCHATSLITEHGKYPANSAFKNQCTLCHTSTDSRVKSAISSGSTACSSCHTIADAHATVHDATFPDPSCSKCHAGNLLSEHVTKRKFSCATCHGNGFAAAATSPSGKTVRTLAGSAQPLAVASGTLSPAALGSVSPTDINDALLAGDTSCSACHDSMPHGVRTDCSTCHGAIAPTTDASEPTSAPRGYATWDATGANAAGPTPHGGYETATTKCAVCHRVHWASESGELLLRGRAEASCEYCHVLTNIGVVVLYNGDASQYYAIHDDYSHNRTSRSSCTQCHSVHGATTLAGSNSSKILWDWTSSGRSAYATEALAAWPDPRNLADHDSQITAFCTGCHAYYVRSYNQTITAQGFDHENAYDWTFYDQKSHIMTDLAGGYANPAADASVQGKPVAFADSRYCRSCHDAGNTSQGAGVHDDSFPHHVTGYWKFMKSSESLASAATTSTTHSDGLCLKCHRLDATTGVGLTF